MSSFNWRRAVAAEFIGTAILLATVVGSGIMAERLAGGNAAVALLANTLATVWVLYLLIESLGPLSGAHFNPAVTLAMACTGRLHGASGRAAVALVAAYVAAQLTGAVIGTWTAHAMFDLPVWQLSQKARTGAGQWLAEAVATAGLLLVIWRSMDASVRARASMLVASWIGAAYWFTASTSFANPAAVAGRMLSDSFAGIAPASALPFVLAQLCGAAAGTWLGMRWASAPAGAQTAQAAQATQPDLESQ